MKKSLTQILYSKLFAIFGKTAMVDQMKFSLIGFLLTVGTSLAVFLIGFLNNSWNQMNLGITGIFVGMTFFAHFAIIESKLSLEKATWRK